MSCLNIYKNNVKNINIGKLDEQSDLKCLKKSIVSNTYNREIYCPIICFNYKKFHLKLYVLANKLWMENHVEGVDYSNLKK